MHTTTHATESAAVNETKLKAFSRFSSFRVWKDEMGYWHVTYRE